ncbi:hypothetical protein QQP08_024063 [Theobroma cacao]|nr:hypothetical protein QQP08_024063 [Theobroma cacao]
MFIEPKHSFLVLLLLLQTRREREEQ